MTKLQKFNPPWTGAYLELPLREAGAAVIDLSAGQLANGNKTADMWADFFDLRYLENSKEEIFIMSFPHSGVLWIVC